MKIIIQRVKSTEVFLGNEAITRIKQGIVVYIGIEIGEKDTNILLLIDQLRSRINMEDEILVLSQFTLLARFKGQKPSFHLAEKPDIAKLYFLNIVNMLKVALPNKVTSGVFGEHIDIVQTLDKPNIELINI